MSRLDFSFEQNCWLGNIKDYILQLSTPGHTPMVQEQMWAEDVVLSCKRILHIYSWFRTGEAGEEIFAVVSGRMQIQRKTTE